MSQKIDIQPTSDRELVICRLVDAPPEKLFEAWTNPKLLVQWFAPHPWTTTKAEMDVYPGGSSLVVMRSPDGHEFPSQGVYLEIIPDKKIVFTDAFTSAWVPSQKPFFTGILTFENQNGKTKYTARTLHWTKEDRDQHAQMGFETGWAQCTDQMEALLLKL
jgi:uncharacterized protein YndB with AHSA1/START domain